MARSGWVITNYRRSMVCRSDPHDRFSDAYGPDCFVGDVMHLRIFGQPMIILGSVQAALDLLEHRSTLYSDRVYAAMLTL